MCNQFSTAVADAVLFGLKRAKDSNTTNDLESIFRQIFYFGYAYAKENTQPVVITGEQNLIPCYNPALVSEELLAKLMNYQPGDVISLSTEELDKIKLGIEFIRPLWRQ